MTFSTVIFVAIIIFLLSIPAAILSFVFVHRTYGGRKALILIFTIGFFVIYGLSIIMLSTDEIEPGFVFMLMACPLPIVSIILILSRPRYVFVNRNTSKNKKKPDLNYLDELERLKKLLESGAITQEEFDKKKKEILKWGR